MLNKNGAWLVATKKITPGEEIFWNYHDKNMWKVVDKLQKKDLAAKPCQILFRDNDKEYERVKKILEIE